MGSPIKSNVKNFNALAILISVAALLLLSGCKPGIPKVTALGGDNSKPQASSRTNLASAGGTTTIIPGPCTGGCKIKFTVGYNQMGPVSTIPGQGHVRSSSSGVLNER